MFHLFTSSKTRLERRLIKQCVNVEKPQLALAMNAIDQHARQPVAKPRTVEVLFVNAIGGQSERSRSAVGNALFITNKKRP
jgi:hypothetical protein